MLTFAERCSQYRRNTVRFFPMRETSGEPLFRNLRFLMLESCVKGLQLLDGHSHRNIPRHLSPLRNRAMNFAQNFKGVLVREMEVSRRMHSVIYFSRRPVSSVSQVLRSRPLSGNGFRSNA